MLLAISLAKFGDAEGTRIAREQLLSMKPNFGLDFLTRCWPFKHQRDQMRLLEGLTAAGF
jgi:hypothetical protein